MTTLEVILLHTHVMENLKNAKVFALLVISKVNNFFELQDYEPKIWVYV